LRENTSFEPQNLIISTKVRPERVPEKNDITGQSKTHTGVKFDLLWEKPPIKRFAPKLGQLNS